MLYSWTILEALAAEVRGLWPEQPVYQDLVPVGFVRPSTLVEVTHVTMTPESRRTAAVKMDLRLTRFQVVDDYHNGQVAVLAGELTALLGRLCCPSLPVGDRWLDVVGCTGLYGNDYAQVDLTLSWIDEVDTAQTEQALMEHYTLAVEAGGESKE